MTPEDAAAWLPVVRDYLALLAGVGLGTLGVVSGHIYLAVAGYALAGLAVDVRTGLLARGLRLLATLRG